MIDISTITNQQFPELEVHTYEVKRSVSERGSITTLDMTPRHFRVADIEQQGAVEVADIDSYPQDLQEEIFPVYRRQNREPRLITQEAFNALVIRMRAIAVDLGYQAEQWAGAMIFRRESFLMQAIHRDRYDYTFEQCLAIIDKFAKIHPYWDLGSLIDNNVPPAEILNFNTRLPFSLLKDLYPTPAG